MSKVCKQGFKRICAAQFLVRFVGLSLVVGGIASSSPAGGVFTLVDGNSVAEIETGSSAGMRSWTVDGINQLNQQWFWYRIDGGDNFERPISDLLIDVEGTTDTNFDNDDDTLFVRYTDALIDPGFTIEVRFILDGGAAGSGASDIAEQISITNTGDVPMSMSFYQYSHFRLVDSPIGNNVVFPNENAVRQFKGDTVLSETVVTPAPTRREAAFFDATLQKLQDGNADDLSDMPPLDAVLGPGDVTWAFQWDFVISPGDTVQISKDKNVIVPEPATFAALLCGLIALGATRYRRRLLSHG